MATSRDGVFAEAIDRAAFFDTVTLSVWGQRRDMPTCPVKNLTSLSIGTRLSKYGRLQRGTIEATGNRFELVYGARRLQNILPPIKMVFRSDQNPVTIEDMNRAIDGFCDGVERVTVSSVELTFDLSSLSVEWLAKGIFTSARRFRTLRDEKLRSTYYVGGPTSPWQARVYVKRRNVTRLEIILRRRFLRPRRISRLEELDLMRYVDLQDCVSIGKPNQAMVELVRRNLGADRGRVFDALGRMLPPREFVVDAERLFGVPREDLVLVDRVNKRIRRMQKRLIC